MATVNLPSDIKDTRAATLWGRDKNNSLPGDTIIVHDPLERKAAQDSYNGIAVPLIPEGRVWMPPNPFTPDGEGVVQTPKGLQDDTDVILLRSAQHPDGTWYGGKVVGMTSAGGNQDGINGTRTDYYEQTGIAVDMHRPHPSLCQAALCSVKETWGDGYAGPGLTWGCHFDLIGRMARLMHWPGSQMLDCVVDRAHRSYALETGDLCSGVEILRNTLGSYGYNSAKCGPGNGYDFGIKFLDNHSRPTDLIANGGTLHKLAPWASVNRWNFNGNWSSDIEIGHNEFPGSKGPGVTISYGVGVWVHHNVINCVGAFADLRGSKQVRSEYNDGGPGMTVQLKAA